MLGYRSLQGTTPPALIAFQGRKRVGVVKRVIKPDIKSYINWRGRCKLTDGNRESTGGLVYPGRSYIP